MLTKHGLDGAGFNPVPGLLGKTGSGRQDRECTLYSSSLQISGLVFAPSAQHREAGGCLPGSPSLPAAPSGHQNPGGLQHILNSEPDALMQVREVLRQQEMMCWVLRSFVTYHAHQAVLMPSLLLLLGPLIPPLDGYFQLDFTMARQANQGSVSAETVPEAMAPVLGCITSIQEAGTAPAWPLAPLCPVCDVDVPEDL